MKREDCQKGMHVVATWGYDMLSADSPHREIAENCLVGTVVALGNAGDVLCSWEGLTGGHNGGAHNLGTTGWWVYATDIEPYVDETDDCPIECPDLCGLLF